MYTFSLEFYRVFSISAFFVPHWRSSANGSSKRGARDWRVVKKTMHIEPRATSEIWQIESFQNKRPST